MRFGSKAEIERDIPGLDPKRVHFYLIDRMEVHPICSLTKKDRKALKDAGYEWFGRWWQWTGHNEEIKNHVDQKAERG